MVQVGSVAEGAVGTGVLVFAPGVVGTEMACRTGSWIHRPMAGHSIKGCCLGGVTIPGDMINEM